PVKERAGTPRALSAIASSAIETCSPVVSSTSISRAGGSGEICFVRSTRRSVESPIAETTTASRSPRSRTAATRAATRLISSTEPTEVPPYFWTMSMGCGRRSPQSPGGWKYNAELGVSGCKLPFDERSDLGQRAVERIGLRAARLGKVGTTAAATADLRGDRADELARLDARRKV